jgi:iron complex outermembrane receptor protein
VTVTVDYWRTQIDNVIGNRAIDFILANPTLYPDLFLRNPDGTLGLRPERPWCTKDAVINTPSNVGALRAAGIDLSLKLASRPSNAWGQPVSRHRRGLPHRVGRQVRRRERRQLGQRTGPVQRCGAGQSERRPVSNATRGLNNRWRHTAQVTWQNASVDGPAVAALPERHPRPEPAGRNRCPGTTGPRDVASYAQYNLMVKYTGIKHLGLSLGISNLLDAQPPLTNHTGVPGLPDQRRPTCWAAPTP